MNFWWTYSVIGLRLLMAAFVYTCHERPYIFSLISFKNEIEGYEIACLSVPH
jgi:hypothetical protein